MMRRIAVKYLPVDLWTNLAIKRVLKLLEALDVGDVPGTPSVESVRGELRDLLARRRAEGVGKANFGVWKEAERKTAREQRRKHAAPTRHRP